MFKILLNPFEKYTEKKLMLFGLFFLIIGSFFGYKLNVKFDSVLHISFVENALFFKIIGQNLVITILLTIVLFALGKFFNPKTRLIDVLNVSLISRIPFYFSTLVNINNATSKLTQKLIKNLDTNQNISFSTTEYILLITTSLLAILFLIWFAILLWQGFKTATNVKKKRDIVLLIITLLIVNFLSSMCIQFLNL